MQMEVKGEKAVHREVHRAAHRVEMAVMERSIQTAGMVLEEREEIVSLNPLQTGGIGGQRRERRREGRDGEKDGWPRWFNEIHPQDCDIGNAPVDGNLSSDL